MLMEEELPAVVPPDVDRADQRPVGLAVAALHARLVGEAGGVVPRLVKAEIGDSKIGPALRIARRGGDLGARIKAPHLGEDQHALLVDMAEEMILAAKPEAVLDRGQIVLQRHARPNVAAEARFR